MRLRQKLQRIAVLGVGGEERDGQTKRLIGRAVAQEFERVVFVALRHVDFGAVGLVEPMVAIVGSTEIEAFGREFSIVPFPHVTDVVAVIAQQAGEGFFPWGFKCIKASVAVAGHPLAGEQTGATHSANGGGHIVVGETHPVLGQLVQMGGKHHWISRRAEGVVPPIVGVENKNIEPGITRHSRHGRGGVAHARKAQDEAEEKGPMNHEQKMRVGQSRRRREGGGRNRRRSYSC